MFKDAESLYGGGRLGTPDHLYGLACECALKAILHGFGLISGTKPKPPYKVHIDRLWDEYISALHGRAMPSLGPNPFRGWTVNDRYEDENIFSETRVANHQKGALDGMKALQRAIEQGKVL